MARNIVEPTWSIFDTIQKTVLIQVPTVVIWIPFKHASWHQLSDLREAWLWSSKAICPNNSNTQCSITSSSDHCKKYNNANNLIILQLSKCPASQFQSVSKEIQKSIEGKTIFIVSGYRWYSVVYQRREWTMSANTSSNSIFLLDKYAGIGWSPPPLLPADTWPEDWYSMDQNSLVIGAIVQEHAANYIVQNAKLRW